MLLWMDGCQDSILMQKPEWSAAPNLIGTGRDGTTNGAMNDTVNSSKTVTIPTPCATIIFGYAFSNTNIALRTNQVSFSTSGGTAATLITTAAGFLEWHAGTSAGTLLGTTSGHPAITNSTWCYVEVKAVLSSTSGSLEVRVNGQTVLTLSGVQTASLTGSVVSVTRQCASSGNLLYDDWYICDATGSVANDFLGDIVIKTLLPSGAGDSTQWTPSAGSNYAAVDEIPPQVTDYVSDSVSGHRDLYNIADTVGTIATVYGVRVGYYAQKSDAGAGLIKPVMKENSTVTAEAGQGVSTTVSAMFSTLHTVRPSDSAAWTQADIDALQVGQEVA